MIRRYALLLLAALTSLPAVAADEPLTPARVVGAGPNSGDVLLGALKLGRRDGGTFRVTAPIAGSIDNGTVGGVAIPAILGTKAPVVSPVFSGTPKSNSLTLTGPASSVLPWAGTNPLAVLPIDISAASDTSAEAGAIIRMTSNKGGSTPSGGGAATAFKIPLGTEMTMLPGSGDGYAFNAVIHAEQGVGNVQVSGIEVNVDIQNKDYPPTIGEPFATSLLLQGINLYRQTAIMFVNNAGYGLGQTPAGKYLTYRGLWFYGPYTVSDETIKDETDATTSYSISGNHSNASISDASNTPAALNLQGNYSVSAVFTGNATTSTALATKNGQRVCLNGLDACMSHGTGGLSYLIGGSPVASISDVGSLTATSASIVGSSTDNLPAASIENNSTASVTSKSTSFDWYGRDTVNTRKQAISVRSAPTDANLVNVDVSLLGRYNDALVERLRITSAGHVVTAGPAPTLSACGTSPTITGNDTAGEVSVGTSATGCTIAFAAAWSAKPSCAVTAQNGARFGYAISATTLTLSNNDNLSNATLNYHCLGK